MERVTAAAEEPLAFAEYLLPVAGALSKSDRLAAGRRPRPRNLAIDRAGEFYKEETRGPKRFSRLATTHGNYSPNYGKPVACPSAKFYTWTPTSSNPKGRVWQRKSSAVPNGNSWRLGPHWEAIAYPASSTIFLKRERLASAIGRSKRRYASLTRFGRFPSRKVLAAALGLLSEANAGTHAEQSGSDCAQTVPDGGTEQPSCG